MNIRDESTAAATSGDEYRSVVEAALAGATVITSNRHAARELLGACERELHHRSAPTAWKTPQVLSWGGWIGRVWTEHNLFAKDPVGLLNEDQELAIWRRLLSENSQRGFLDIHGAAALCQQAWTLLHEYRIRLERRAFQVSAETRRFFECAAKYARLTKKYMWTEAARLPDQLSAGLESSLLPKQVILFGFDELTPQQNAFCERLTASGVSLRQVKGAVKQAVTPVKIAMPSVEDELRAAARWARSKLEQDSQARIGIVVPQLQQLRRETEQVLRQTFYPAGDLPRTPAYHVSLGPPLPEYPLIRTALAVLRWATGALAFPEVSYLLRSPYLHGAKEEMHRRAMLELELRKWLPSLTMEQAAAWMEKSAVDQACHVLLRVLKQALQTSETLTGRKQKAGAWAEKFSHLLEMWGWPGTDSSSEEYQVAEKLREVFARFASLDAVSAELDVNDAVTGIARIAQGTLFRVENQGAAVQVMGPLEAAGSCFDLLWVTGSSDSVWPLRGQLNPLLPFALQRAHGVPYSSPERQQVFSRQVFDRLLASSAECVFSWAENDGEEVLDPCPWLAALPQAQQMTEAPPVWAERQRAGAELEEWVDERAPLLAPGKYKGGTRLLELQSACPFHAVAELRLGAKRLEEASLGIDAREHGRVVELALQYLWEDFRDLRNYENLSPAERERVYEESAKRAMQELPPAEVAWQQRHLELEREALVALLKEWMTVEVARTESFRVVAHQEKIEMRFAGLELNGKVDRIDRLGDGSLVILDYKTGEQQSTKHWAGARPEKPQLPAYVVTKGGEKVSAVAFAQVHSGESRFKGYSERAGILGSKESKPKDGRSFTEHKAGWKRVLEDLASQYLEGQAAVDPKRYPQTCEYCHLHAVCRVGEDAQGVDQQSTEVRADGDE